MKKETVGNNECEKGAGWVEWREGAEVWVHSHNVASDLVVQHTLHMGLLCVSA